jgi:hypothetical protein
MPGDLGENGRGSPAATRTRSFGKQTKAAPIEAALEEFFQLAHDPVRPVPRLALARLDLKPELLRHVPADKPSNAVVRPVGGLGDFREGCAFLAAHQFQDNRCFTAGFCCALPPAWLRSFLRGRCPLRLCRSLAGFRLLWGRGLRG